MAVYKLDEFLTIYWVCRKPLSNDACEKVMSIWVPRCSLCKTERSRDDLALDSSGSVHGIFFKAHEVMYNKACATKYGATKLTRDLNQRERGRLVNARGRATKRTFTIPTTSYDAWPGMKVGEDEAEANSAVVHKA